MKTGEVCLDNGKVKLSGFLVTFVTERNQKKNNLISLWKVVRNTL